MDEGTDALSDRMEAIRSVVFDPVDPGSDATYAEPAGSVILLLSGGASNSWAAESALALCGAWAREDRRVVLADLHLDLPLLDGRSDAESPEGIVDILLYGASLSRVAQPLRGDEFYQIPAGTFALDPEEVFRHPRWKRLIAGFHETGGALVLFAPAAAPGVEALIEHADNILLLGGGHTDPALAVIRRAGREPFALLRPPPEPEIDGAVDGEDATDMQTATVGARVSSDASDPTGGDLDADFDPILDDHPDVGAELEADSYLDAELDLPPPESSRRSTRSRGSLVLWVFVLAALIGIAAFLLASLRPELFSRATGSVAEVVAAPAPVEGSELNQEGDLLLYSVQVRAFTSFDAALDATQSEQLRLPSIPYFVSQEEIQGVVYHRILAGFAADTLGATRLRDTLVESGVIDPEDAAGAWSLIQFTPLAFDLGEYPTLEEAISRADSLLVRQIPTYRVTIPYSDGSERWKLYAGAYRDSIGAASMRARLNAVGIEARLIARTGTSVPAVE